MSLKGCTVEKLYLIHKDTLVWKAMRNPGNNLMYIYTKQMKKKFKEVMCLQTSSGESFRTLKKTKYLFTLYFNL